MDKYNNKQYKRFIKFMKGYDIPVEYQEFEGIISEPFVETSKFYRFFCLNLINILFI